MLTPYMRSKFERAWMRAGGTNENFPLASEEVLNDRGDATGLLTHTCVSPFDWRRDEFLKWAGLPTQGVGILGFREAVASNSWLRKPACMTERQYITALQLRAGVYPTREFRCRGRSKTEATCRRCPHRLESCSHILGQCPTMSVARIARHHKLCRLLGAEAESLGWEARQEWEFRTCNVVVRRLDLVLIRGDCALVIDVTVRYELAPDTLTVAGLQKEDYYGPYKNVIASKLGVKHVQIFGFPLGVRGLWHKGNTKLLETIGMGKRRMKSFAKLMSRRCLLYSLEILRRFSSTRRK